MKISVGADPEIFLFDKKKKTHVSAHTLIPGTKDKPHKVRNGAVQVDGTAAEFNIDPCFTSAQFTDNMVDVLHQLRMMIPKELEFSFSPTVRFSPAYFKALPDDCKILGCDPDYDMKGNLNPPPKPKDLIRHGGGHIHIGWTKGKDVKDPDHFWDCQQVGATVSKYFQYTSKLWDEDEERSKVYANGSFRPKPYGVEVRSFSNAWVKYPKLWPWMFDSIQDIVNKLEKGELVRGHNSDPTLYAKRMRIDQVNQSLRWYNAPLVPQFE